MNGQPLVVRRVTLFFNDRRFRITSITTIALLSSACRVSDDVPQYYSSKDLGYLSPSLDLYL
jgi:hypothetical protein